MKRRISLIALLVVLMLPLASTAFAHNPVPRTILIDGGYRIVYGPHGHHGVPPYWLHHDASFRHWYHASRYRYMHRLGWAQLHDLYRVEVRLSRPVRHYHYRGCEHDRHHRRGRRH